LQKIQGVVEIMVMKNPSDEKCSSGIVV
jgi:hypothetical protein